MKFMEGLQLSFIILRLCGVIEWSWVWVLAPIWVDTLLRIISAIIKKENRDEKSHDDVRQV